MFDSRSISPAEHKESARVEAIFAILGLVALVAAIGAEAVALSAEDKSSLQGWSAALAISGGMMGGAFWGAAGLSYLTRKS